VKTSNYFQVDNPLVHLGDFAFVGRHLAERAEVSSKVVAKQHPTEKLGNLAIIDGRCGMIEYSDLPESLAQARDADGRLLLWAGSPAIHLFDLAFLQRMTSAAGHIPWHVARKKVPHLGPDGGMVHPKEENALKFERFIFDVLPHAERWTVLETTRGEFEPLKNATGAESPATVRGALVEQAAGWLEENGVRVPRDGEGRPKVPIEISPLLALEASDLAGKLPANLSLDRPMYLE
jgi:UDP-N-acetylglucosamine/UDP-N-acetylgalactosamine diphosphorylase